jgi:hypothetical protein
MTPETLLLLAEKNAKDIEAIVGTIGPKVGITTLLSLMPNIVNILQTLQTAQQSPVKS